MVGAEGFEPSTISLRGCCARPLRHAPEVHAAGIEPAPLGLKGRCSPMSHTCECCGGTGAPPGKVSRTCVASSPRWTHPSPHLHYHCDSVVKAVADTGSVSVLPWGRPDSNRVGYVRRGYGPPRCLTVNDPVLERPAGFEPASSAWRAEILPLNDGRAHVEPPAGIEPATSGLRNRRCFQLSYRGNGTPPRIRTSPWEFWRLPLAQPARCVSFRCSSSRENEEGREPFGARPSEVPV